LIAQWIIGRQVVNTQRQTRILFPLFQFDAVTMCPSGNVQRVIRELRDVLDDEQLCDWFSRPNSWLDGEIPAQTLSRCACAVFEAARADRYILRG
jgi:hypothetical protein